MKTTRREFLMHSALGVAGLAGLAGCVGQGLTRKNAAQRRPNVILFLTDDQSPHEIGCLGGNVLTPNIDRLARDGMMFNNAHVSASVCTPSRFTCLTGRYASKCLQLAKGQPAGTQSFVAWNAMINDEEVTLPRVLQSAGYKTGAVGKWHNGMAKLGGCKPDADPSDPEVAAILKDNQEKMVAAVKAAGFDYAAAIYKGNLNEGMPIKAMQHHSMEWVTKGALDFIDQNREKPFFLYMATTLQHGPSPLASFHADPRITGEGMLDEPLKVMPPRSSILERLKAAGIPETTAHCTWLDDGIGAVLNRLDRHNLMENTVVIFMNDNGMGAKGTCYEGGTHVPLFVYWKGRIEGGRGSDELVQNIDLAPTILELCGVTPPPTMGIDGTSLSPLLFDRPAQWRDSLFFEMYYSRAVRTRKWKYIAWRYPKDVREKLEQGVLEERPALSHFQDMYIGKYPCWWDPDQLYDLENDPNETKNLANDPAHRQTLESMKSLLTKYLEGFPHTFGEFKTL